jgi:hypothetical protein
MRLDPPPITPIPYIVALPREDNVCSLAPQSLIPQGGVATSAYRRENRGPHSCILVGEAEAMESGSTKKSPLARLVLVPETRAVQAYHCFHRGGRAIGGVQPALSGRGPHQGAPYRIRRCDNFVRLFDVSSLLKDGAFMFARRRDIVCHSSCV